MQNDDALWCSSFMYEIFRKAIYDKVNTGFLRRKGCSKLVVVNFRSVGVHMAFHLHTSEEGEIKSTKIVGTPLDSPLRIRIDPKDAQMNHYFQSRGYHRRTSSSLIRQASKEDTRAIDSFGVSLQKRMMELQVECDKGDAGPCRWNYRWSVTKSTPPQDHTLRKPKPETQETEVCFE